VDDAIGIFNNYPRCAGIAYHVADAINKRAAVVETSATRVAVRYPLPGQNFLYQANNSNCYPGWMGYEGYNMVVDQSPVNELTNVLTIDAWQDSIKDPANKYVQAPSRVERYGELLAEHYGKITLETAQKIMSDRFDPYTQREREKWEPLGVKQYPLHYLRALSRQHFSCSRTTRRIQGPYCQYVEFDLLPGNGRLLVGNQRFSG